VSITEGTANEQHLMGSPFPVRPPPPPPQLPPPPPPSSPPSPLRSRSRPP
jgi:hypothetical protein